jgi:hypothetical protein
MLGKRGHETAFGLSATGGSWNDKRPKKLGAAYPTPEMLSILLQEIHLLKEQVERHQHELVQLRMSIGDKKRRIVSTYIS